MNYAEMLDDLARWNGSFGGGIPSEADIEAAMRGDVDAETMALMRAYCHTLDRGDVTDEVRSVYPEEWKLSEFQDLIADAIERIPADKRDVARVKLEGGYDESTYLRFEYDRPQTDTEWALDVAHALMRARKRQADDMAAYNRLSKKFAKPVVG